MTVLLILTLAMFYAVLFWWAFRVLPLEEWQILAAVPARKESSGAWEGLNLTYYGALTALAVLMAVAIFLVLMASIAVPVDRSALFAVLLLMCCLPAARRLASWIEGKPSTFTIGGAAFLGLVLAPGLVLVLNSVLPTRQAPTLPMMPTMAALAVAYAFGEGTGRLACISFGCCYGKPLAASSRMLHRIFRRFHFAFSGPTKKISYESDWELVPVIPIQAVTAMVFIALGFTGLVLFLQGSLAAGFLVTACGTQLWRVVSELLRADYRGGSRWSVYQTLGFAGAGASLLLGLLAPLADAVRPDLLAGLQQVWTPSAILGLQLLWAVVFWYTGRSRVTTARISLAVVRDRI